MMAVPDKDLIHERFERHVSPLRDALSRLLNASDELRDAWGSMPAADSRAMAEIAAEDRFSGADPWGPEPITQAHNSGQLLLFAATDCARAAIRLLDSDPNPVYAHIVLARATLESAGRAWSLLDPTIGTRLRVARGVNERLFGLSEQGRFPLAQADKERARQRRTALFAEGERLGFRKVKRGRKMPPTLEEERLGQTALVRALLRSGDDVELGRVVYGVYSAIAHGTLFGLTGSVTLDAPGAPKTPGVTWGAIYTSSGHVVSALTALALGVGKALDARNRLFGWKADSWDSAFLDAIRAAQSSLPDPPQRPSSP